MAYATVALGSTLASVAVVLETDGSFSIVRRSAEGERSSLQGISAPEPLS